MAEYREVRRVAESDGRFPPIIMITGPTAVGKSAVAMALALRIGAEIVSADSRQVYRYLDIGTAKPAREEQERVRHHVYCVVDPDEPYSAALFRRDAEAALIDITCQGRVALVVGGTYHYLQVLLDRLEIPAVPPDQHFRRDMELLAAEHGPEALHARLAAVDPVAAQGIAAANVRRVVRALEVHRATGQSFSAVGRRRGTPVEALRLAITTDRPNLYRRIDDRVEQQIRDGLFDEARRVLEMGFDPGLPPLAGLVYREAIGVVAGRMTPAEAAKRMKETTHAFARRQYTWFRRDPRLDWIELGPDTEEQVARRVEGYLAERRAGS